jgi:Flp pilus assembly CpaF family ATPase/Fe-S-cluster-containing hydrogenase component 2
MYLKLKDLSKGEGLFNNCYQNFDKKDVTVFNCRNCEDAFCVTACKQGAITRTENGIVVINSKICNNCLECVSACPNNAIVVKKGSPRKCDLCVNNSFLMPCYYANKEVLEFIDDVSVSSLQAILDKYLGYIITTEKYLRGLSLDGKVMETFENKQKYILRYQRLSREEIKVINDILDSYKFKTLEEATNEISVKKDLEDELVDYCLKNNIELDSDQYQYLIDMAYNNLYEFGPLSQLLADFNLEEISIIGINLPVFVYHRHYGWLETNLKYVSEQKVKDLINKLGWYSNKYITLKNPIMDATLKDHTRLNALISPITESVSLTIRKFSEKPLTIYDILKFNTITKEALSFLKLVFLTDANVFVVGNTGSGKTTTLNALLNFIPTDQRIVIVEEVHEINISHPHKVLTSVNKELGINMDNLIINTLRMRPDKVVIGEVRTREESFSLIDSLLSGQAKGTYTTFHAQSANDAVLRLLSYGILESDIGAIDLIITQRRYNEYSKENETIQTKDKRKVFEISEIDFKDNKIKINKIFEYDFKTKKLIFKNFPKKLMQKFQVSFNISSTKELKERIRQEEQEIFSMPKTKGKIKDVKK